MGRHVYLKANEKSTALTTSDFLATLTSSMEMIVHAAVTDIALVATQFRAVNAQFEAIIKPEDCADGLRWEGIGIRKITEGHWEEVTLVSMDQFSQ
jgi:hypothetical protein